MRTIKFLLLFLLVQSKLYAQIPNIEDKSIKLQSVDIETTIVGNTAVTKVKYVFNNPTNRELEAKLTFPLPEGTTVTKYAIDINGKMRDAVSVPKERGKEVFESIQHRQVDPGLIEKVSGNNFRSRISPVPAKGSRTMEVTFLQELNPINEFGLAEYVLPLNNQLYPSFNLSVNYFGNSNPPIFTEKPDGTLNFENNDKKWIANLRKTDFSPSGSMRIQLPFANKDEVNSLFQSASNNQFYFLSSIQVPLEVPKVVLPSKIAVVWDNSFSTSERDFLKE